MRMLAIACAVVLFLGGCGGGGNGELPSCSDAFTHYYGAGCVYADQDGPFTVNDMVQLCREASSDVPPSCEGEFEDWILCHGNVPDEATQNSDCDCNSEFDALFSCE